MSALFLAWYKICLLRLAPQDLPAARELLYLSALLMFGSGVLLLALTNPEGMRLALVLIVTIDLALSALLLYLALQLLGRLGRLPQSLTALFGSSTLLQLALLPPLLLVGEDPNATALSQLATLVVMGLFLWSLLVIGHILRHAFEVPLWAGVGIAIGYWIVAGQLMQAMGLV